MYKILLADDDYHVLEYLDKMIPWSNLGFEVVGLSENGEQALEQVNQNKPDVIMTDIGMPHMDGITLIKRVHEQHPRIKSIFLTCYDEFHYAQEAIRLGAFDYILKETMDADNITRMMERLKAELDEALVHREVLYNMKFLIKENLTVLRSKLLERLLSGDTRTMTDWMKKHEQELELDLSHRHSIPVLCFIDDGNDEQHTDSPFQDDTLKFAVDNVISETISRSSGKGFCLFHHDDTFFILYTRDSYITEDQIQHTMNDIRANLRQYLRVSITSIVGNRCTFPDGLPAHLHQLLQASEHRFYLPHSSIIKYHDMDLSSPDEHVVLESEQSEEVKRLIIREDEDGLQEWVHRWEQDITHRRIAPDMVKKHALGLLLDVEKMILSLQDDGSDSVDSALHHQIGQAKTARQLAERLLEALRQYIVRMREINNLPKKTEILKARKFVLLNLDKKITLGDIADHLHLNPSYFSRMFKQQTEMNFTDYVNQMKMEEAKRLLEQTGDSVEMIAEKLGFESKSYFLKVFRKYYGTSPVEYRKGARADQKS